MRPHRDGTLSEHGFVSLVPEGESSLAAVWLDGRQFQKDAKDNEMSLFFTRLNVRTRGLDPEVKLDARVCECCQTTMTRTRNGLFVAYRDRSPDEIRDISFLRSVSGKWSKPASLNEDGWHLTGCPVNGPQADSVLSDGRDFLAVAWFTAAGGDPRVQVKFSDDGGATFGDAIRVDDGNPVGRVDIVAGDADALVAWVERGERATGELRMRRVTPSGVEASVVVGRTSSGRASGFPRIARLHDDVFVSWTEAESRTGPSAVRVARVHSKE
jgi:hypothetical protein